MKKAGIAVLIIILVVGAGSVFLVLNKPASIFIRNAFKQIKDIRLTTDSDQRYKDQIIEQLQQQQNIHIMREDSLLRVNQSHSLDIIILKANQSSLKAVNQTLEKKLAEAKPVHFETSVSDQAILWDRQTAGQKVTLIIDYDDEQMVITEPTRIADANWKIHEGETVAQMHANDQEAIVSKDQQIKKLEAININLENARLQCHEQKTFEIKKREICEQSANDAMKRAKKFATGGGIAMIAAILILIL